MNEYRVNLDSYNGPLDLLLYLIRRDELDIYDIPIARITQQYVEYVKMLQQLDPNLAGEFLVLAATLIEIKTRMLLPAAPAEDGAAQESGIDPRSELVRQLLEYKAFKDAAGDLADAAGVRSQKFARRPVLPPVDPGELDLEDVQIWDLLDAFGKILESIGRTPGEHEVVYDDTPVELHAVDIMDRLQRDGAMTFRKIFEGRTSRSEIVGLFIALLELVRQKKVFALQDHAFDEIQVQLNPNPPSAEETEQVSPDQFIQGHQEKVDEAQAAAGASNESEQSGQTHTGQAPLQSDGAVMNSYVIKRAGGEVALAGKPWRQANKLKLESYAWYSSGQKQGTEARILYDDDALYLQFICQDKHIFSQHTELNGPVCLDSCVEFFATMDPAKGPDYFNIEVNCCGTFHLGFGPERSARKLIDAELAKTIEIKTSVPTPTKEESPDDKSWWVAVRLPLATLRQFTAQDARPAAGTRWMANVYRCGGKTDEQFPTWNPILCKQPDYHRPEYFGEMLFE